MIFQSMFVDASLPVLDAFLTLFVSVDSIIPARDGIKTVIYV